MSEILEDGRDLDCRIAEHVMGFHVENVRPEWYRGREVTLFFHPEGPKSRTTGTILIAYSYDDDSCNAIMHRNGVDDSDGSALPLPLYSEEPDAGIEVAEHMREQGFRVVLDGGSEGWECMMERDGAFFTGKADTIPRAICLAALSTETPDTGEAV